MKIEKTSINIGIEEKIKFLHITDSHIILADKRDDQRKIELMKERRAAYDIHGFDCCMKNFDAQLNAYKNGDYDLLLHTGDLIDFSSHKNIETVRSKLEGIDYLFATGNHEFSLYVGETKEDNAYKMQSFDRIQNILKNDLTFASRIIGGVNLVTIDNSYYQFTTNQLEFFMQEIQKGLPIILLMHVPIYTEKLYNSRIYEKKEKRSALIAQPKNCPTKEEQASKETLKFIEYLKKQTLVKAVIAGHYHYSFEDVLYGNVMQYVTGGGFYGIAREIEVI